MIEIIDAERCTSCDICVNVCPTNVFDKTSGIPVVARQSDCQTCFLCELYCPEDALYVSPFADGTQPVDVAALKQANGMGTYRRAVGWTSDTKDRRSADRSFLLFGH
ncbi:4Fe-4S ferredoxin [Bradyrhizobium sp. CCBAU 11430]|uniref:4Fe-4S dicluster domain-containing protein n=1 Tax=unclassified Bradyrhizobium TaxID=2631580 RepID=UPI002305CEBC|nr:MULTISPECIES: ferredoxin family protein [unclassified Bradyrhizobium]MDA9413888.1 4Fe-4S ferredoxin [Bradyrhizobium sp. CCBAU 25360]MDA9516710.1 4Fe-4S ferredoxin [Bradyrhizobium sp. CCBAU 11430]